MGGRKKVLDFAPFLQAARLLYEGPWVAERYIATEDIITRQPESMLPVIRTIIGSAEGKTAMDAFRAEYEMQAYHVQAKAALSDIDFLVTPTAGTIYAVEEVNAEPILLNSRLGYYTNYMNLLDCASVAVPAGFLDNGLPWGISLVSGCMQDRKLLSFANLWQQHLNISPGNLDYPLPKSSVTDVDYSDTIPLVVCGAHLEGLALNWQLQERGAWLQQKTLSAPSYRMFVIEGAVPRPGMVRDEADGKALEIEIWQVPKAELGSFVAGIAAPLGIGKVETSDGRWLSGFICEGYAVSGAEEVTMLGGWRRYLQQRAL
jgi:allophanate hydrolase